jgi:hypothetical protein
MWRRISSFASSLICEDVHIAGLSDTISGSRKSCDLRSSKHPERLPERYRIEGGACCMRLDLALTPAG